MKRSFDGKPKTTNLLLRLCDEISAVAEFLMHHDLCELAVTCKEVHLKVLQPLTQRSVYDLDDVMDWSSKRKSWVRSGTVSVHCFMPEVPCNLRKLELTKFSSAVLQPGTLPETLEDLRLSDFYNTSLRGVLPTRLEKLFVGNEFNQSITGVLPSSLRELYLGDKFTQRLRIGDLPVELEVLEFGKDYSNTPIDDDVLPVGLCSLTLPDGFDQPLTQRTLPSGLISLTFGSYFSGPIEPGSLPASLQRVTIGQYYDADIEVGVLPSGVRSLAFDHGFDCEIKEGAFPTGLTALTVCDCYDHPFPERPPKLYIGSVDCPCGPDW